MSRPNTPARLLERERIGALTSKEDRFAIYVHDSSGRRWFVQTTDVWSEVPEFAKMWAVTNRKKTVQVIDRAKRGSVETIENSIAVKGGSEMGVRTERYSTPTLLVYTAWYDVGNWQLARSRVWQIDGAEWRAAPVNEFDVEAGKWLTKTLHKTGS